MLYINQLKEVLSNVFLGTLCKRLSTRVTVGGITGKLRSSLIWYQIRGCSSSGFLLISQNKLRVSDYCPVLEASNKQSHYMVCQWDRYKIQACRLWSDVCWTPLMLAAACQIWDSDFFRSAEEGKFLMTSDKFSLIAIQQNSYSQWIWYQIKGDDVSL